MVQAGPACCEPACQRGGGYTRFAQRTGLGAGSDLSARPDQFENAGPNGKVGKTKFVGKQFRRRHVLSFGQIECVVADQGAVLRGGVVCFDGNREQSLEVSSRCPRGGGV